MNARLRRNGDSSTSGNNQSYTVRNVEVQGNLRACANSACSILSPDPVEVELGPAGVTWISGNTLTITEQVPITAQHTTPGSR